MMIAKTAFAEAVREMNSDQLDALAAILAIVRDANSTVDVRAIANEVRGMSRSALGVVLNTGLAITKEVDEAEKHDGGRLYELIAVQAVDDDEAHLQWQRECNEVRTMVAGGVSVGGAWRSIRRRDSYGGYRDVEQDEVVHSRSRRRRRKTARRD